MDKKPNKLKKDFDTVGRRRKFGYPIDFNLCEQLAPDKVNPVYKNMFVNLVQKALLKRAIENGNPQSKLIEDEEKEVNQQVVQLTHEWLAAALKRLPPNQEICLHLRFHLDTGSINMKVRSTREIGETVGINQKTAYLNVQRGLKALRKDFKTNLEPKLRKLRE